VTGALTMKWKKQILRLRLRMTPGGCIGGEILVCHPEPFGFAQDKLREGSAFVR
jgi:hypothetical protein